MVKKNSIIISGEEINFIVTDFKNEIKVKSIAHPPLTPRQELFLEHFNEEGKFVANLPFLDEAGNLILESEEE